MEIDAVVGDLTRCEVDAVVNAANPSLLGGGGVDGALHRAAGPDLVARCRMVRATTHPNGLATGDAVATGAGLLPARFVIHTVGPIYADHPGGGPDLLAACHRRSLEVAAVLGLRSIAFPAISCGAYGWQAHAAAPVGVEAVRTFFATFPDCGIDLVRFVLSTAQVHDAFRRHVAS